MPSNIIRYYAFKYYRFCLKNMIIVLLVTRGAYANAFASVSYFPIPSAIGLKIVVVGFLTWYPLKVVLLGTPHQYECLFQIVKKLVNPLIFF